MTATSESDHSDRPRIIAVMTSFNRKPTTLACLDALAAAASHADVDLQAVLVDDASTDGTAQAVLARHAWVEVVNGSGDLFWNRGMHKAFALAMSRDATHYLWLNDDTVLLPDAIERLLTQSTALSRISQRPVILVGATANRETGTITYGGGVPVNRLRRFNFRKVWDKTDPVECQSMNGNCVLIARELALRVGNLDPLFEHAMGDIDYALRARTAGFQVFVTGGVVGYCNWNSKAGTFSDESLSLPRRWQLIRSRKGLPFKSWLHFSRRHGGAVWPIYFLWPYASILLSGLRTAARGAKPDQSRGVEK